MDANMDPSTDVNEEGSWRTGRLGWVALAALVVVLVAALLTVGPLRDRHAQAAGTPAGSVTVDGAGTASVIPTSLQLQLSVGARNADVSAALSTNNLDVAQLLKVLTAHGVAATDVATTDLNVNQAYDAHGHFDGYSVQRQVTVTLNNLATAGATITAIQTSGGNAVAISSLTPMVTPSTAELAVAQKNAYAAAAASAGQYAQLAHRSLGAVLSIHESTESTPDGTYGLPAAASASVSAAAVPIAVGSQSISVTVTVDWALN